jgi:uncharacterized protein
MLKALIVGLAIALLLWWLFGRSARGDSKPPRRRGGAERDAEAEAMVACAHCGVHLPRSDALAARGLHYCSATHRDALSDS